ncbi:type VII secretion target [Actinoplanes teichomyceticus]|uniref:Excreted virulence factor EspC (Type VII ESX diderm) n=1 Tax=Actinoplanes teichomyceticus TaxID=1867 RepID=A0A561WB54_ACTTI|nr:type VII secretion target [Actinoplanes teichomyceticus]TWG21088.1 excreted virulence factor EspC (type VII ESX diderm) [Actinoplanes teichomyceticus]GIF14907.1 hypothetical protein Ate01nite_49390 [Actinoplanes teichomyceticus]
MTTPHDGLLADPAQIRRHAGQVQAIDERLRAVRAASASIAHDSTAFGLLCSWLPPLLRDRHRRQDELVAYVAGSLALLAGELRSAAADYEHTDTRSASAIRAAGAR